MTLETIIKSARILLTDKDNTEYVRGICELLAAAFPKEAIEPEERAQEIEALIFCTPLERAIKIIDHLQNMLDTIVNDGVKQNEENAILYRSDINNARALLAWTDRSKEELRI